MEDMDLIQLFPALQGRAWDISAMPGGLTNRNYRITGPIETFVLRVDARDTTLLGIDRACELEASRSAAAIGVGPEVIDYLPDHGALLRRYIQGTPFNVSEVRTRLSQIGRLLRCCHQITVSLAEFSPFRTVRSYYSVARERGVLFPENLAPALDLFERVEKELAQTETSRCLCHNDLLADNFIHDGGRIRLIDWEYAGLGDPFFDLGNVAANNEFEDGDERLLLIAYSGAAAPDQLRRLRLMRFVSDMRESMWGFVQRAISTLPIDFPGYARKHLDRALSLGIRPSS